MLFRDRVPTRVMHHPGSSSKIAPICQGIVTRVVHQTREDMLNRKLQLDIIYKFVEHLNVQHAPEDPSQHIDWVFVTFTMWWLL